MEGDGSAFKVSVAGHLFGQSISVVEIKAEFLPDGRCKVEILEFAFAEAHELTRCVQRVR